MILYISNLIFVYIACLVSRIFNENNNKILAGMFLLLAFLSMFFISGFRYGVGTDYFNYEYIFKNISLNNISAEFSYDFLSIFIKKFFSNAQIIFLVTSFIILMLFFISIPKYSKRYELSIFLFITMYHFYYSMNIVRQYIAISIVLYGIRYIFSENFKKYLFCVIFASTFHSSAIIAIIIYFLRKKFLLDNHITTIIIFLFALLVYNNVENVFYYVSILIPKYKIYTQNSINIEEGSYLNVIVYGILLFIMYLYKNKIIQRDKENILYMNMLVVTFILSIVDFKTVLFGRVLLYFSIYCILIIPKFIDIFNKKLKIIMYLCILYVGFLYNIILLSFNFSNVLPFAFRFF